MMTLITGAPGNGKTLYAVWLIDEQLKKGRAVYTDIKGIKLPGVQPAPDDWRTLPDGAFVVYDEAHKRFPAFKGKGRSPLQVVRDMDEHRHRGFDFLFITQSPEKVDQELFSLCGAHHHLHRSMGLQQANLTKFSRAMRNPYSATSRKGADETIWSYPQHLYAMYDSASIHTEAHKFKMPAKVKAALATLPFIALILWGFTWFITPKAREKPESERSGAEPSFQASTAARYEFTELDPREPLPPTGEFAAAHASPVPQLAGCVSSDRGCRCFNVEGLQLDITQVQCRGILERPLPINLFHPYAAPAGGEFVRPENVTPVDGPSDAAGVVVSDSPASRPDVFPRSSGYSSDSYTGQTSTL